MSFWDTIRGHQLADTLIRELPNLTRKRKQILICSDSNEGLDQIFRLIKEEGYLYVGTFKTKSCINENIVVLEKSKQ